MFHFAAIATLASASTFALASCTGPSADTNSPAPSPTPSSAPPTSQTSAAPKKAYTAQGFLSKKLGELSGWDCTSDIESCSIKFTVEKIDVNPKCTTYGAPPASGRKTLLLHVSLTTGTLSQDGSYLAPTLFNPFSLKGLSQDGFVHDAKPGSCTDQQNMLSTTILPNSRYTGTVEVEVPDSATSVASAHEPTKDGGRGWVWAIV
ncbi:hypothetical protein ACIRG5_10950 [Lentzea sp. NPDC102401]|uniref:hypothetical protein n=1 Tax=Lentzea sp. NPDC102401 TaxID=3364128 RepID=UPI0038261B7C